jgi:hypothetical protein
MQTADSTNKAVYERNTTDYIAKLVSLDKEFQTVVDGDCRLRGLNQPKSATCRNRRQHKKISPQVLMKSSYQGGWHMGDYAVLYKRR